MVADLPVAPGGVPEKMSMQLPHQEGDLPSRATQNVPAMAPDSTLPQPGGWPRTLPRDPT